MHRRDDGATDLIPRQAEAQLAVVRRFDTNSAHLHRA
jgi:hypothetical protein